VRDREDGTNVNGWHWEEKDLLPRFQTALNEQLLGHTLFDNDIGKISIKKIDSCTGEFSGNQRKGKRFIVYEFEIKFEFEATLVSGAATSGKYVFPACGLRRRAGPASRSISSPSRKPKPTRKMRTRLRRRAASARHKENPRGFRQVF